MAAKRNMEYKKFWQELIERYGSLCYYCRKEIATTIDHVVPYSWDGDNRLDNLVPACVLCNCLASNKMFDSVEHKRQYILAQRAKRTNQRAICTSCLLPYTYRTHSPSILLCAECYDKEYGTKFSDTFQWRKWLTQLRAAGIPAEAHRKVKKRAKSGYGRDAKLEILIDEYASVLNTDEDFAALLIGR
jgi:hypothetical protein